MKSKALMLAALAVMTAAASSCSDSLQQAVPEPEPGTRTVRLEVLPMTRDMEAQTRSSVTTGEKTVMNINILFYHDGLLTASGYIENPSVASFLLNEGMTFNVYAVANVGKIAAPDKESDFLKYRFEISGNNYVSQLSRDGFPMVWSRKDYVVSGSVTQLPVELTRLVSKIRFRIDKDALAGLKVTSVRLRNGAGIVTPFTPDGHGGSKVTKSSEIVDGDYASAADLSSLNAGGQVEFYALENCQGILLPGNRDPWKKTPDNISVAGLCTYLEVGCEFQSGFALAGSIVYRVYLGQDNCTDFDIIRNVDAGVTLYLTRNLDNVSWKIDPDVEYNGGSMGSLWVEEGMHSTDDLFIGETVRLGFDVDANLEDFLGAGLEGCTLVAQTSGSDNNAFKFGSIEYSSRRYFCDMKCLKESLDRDNGIWLKDASGRLVTEFKLQDGGLVSQKPQLVVGDGRTYRPTDQIRLPQEYPNPLINGDKDFVSLYLCDYDGRNLNCDRASGQYGFDMGVFGGVDMDSKPSSGIASIVGASIASSIAGLYRMGYNKEESMNNGAAYTCIINIDNPGTSSLLNRGLSQIYRYQDGHDGANDIVKLDFSNSDALSCEWTGDFGIVTPKFFLGSGDTFMSSGMTGKTFLGVYNPSKIDYHADLFYVGRRYTSTSSAILNNGENLIYWNRGGYVPSYLTPQTSRVSSNPIIGDRSYADLLFTSSAARDVTIDGLSCKLHCVDATGGVDVMAMKDGQKSDTRMDVGITTLGKKILDYEYEDLNSTYVTSGGTIMTSAQYDYTWGDEGYRYWGCGWYTGDRLSTALDANKDSKAASLQGYSGRNLYNLMRESPIMLTVKWDTSQNAPVIVMSGNTFGVTLKYLVGLVYRSTCTWSNNSGSSSHTSTYSVSVPATATASTPYTYTVSGQSATTAIVGASTIESKFAEINKNYWHENCTNAINLKSNRFSEMAMPLAVDYYISVLIQDNNVWVPLQTFTFSPLSAITASRYTFYSHTARGTYADTSSMTNPDGSDRGSDSSVSSQASRYSDYTTATATYNVSFSFMNRSVFNWYDL